MTAIDDRCFGPWVGLFPAKINFISPGLYLFPVLLIWAGTQSLSNRLNPFVLELSALLYLLIPILAGQTRISKELFAIYWPFHPNLFDRITGYKDKRRYDDPSMAADLTGHNDEIC